MEARTRAPTRPRRLAIPAWVPSPAPSRTDEREQSRARQNHVPYANGRAKATHPQRNTGAYTIQTLGLLS
jgi:hypothetical protein